MEAQWTITTDIGYKGHTKKKPMKRSDLYPRFHPHATILRLYQAMWSNLCFPWIVKIVNI